MISSVTLGAITLKCNSVNKIEPKRIIHVSIPGRTGDLFQTMGTGAQRVMLSGIINGGSKDTDKSTLEGYKGTTQTYTDTDESFTIIVEEVDIPTQGGRPNHYTFMIEGSKYAQT